MSMIGMGERVTGKHVLTLLIAFFGITAAVNAVFIYFALSTHNGLERPDAYENGLRYNRTLAAARAQAELGWSHALAISPEGKVVLTVKDAEGLPVKRLEFTGVLGRPSSSRFDIALDFVETSPGVYASHAALPDSGAWVASVVSSRKGRNGTDETYALKERLWLPPQQ